MSGALSDPTSEQFATARAIADRWSCHVDTVYCRLEAAGVPAYRFTLRLIRWRWTDVLAYEDSLVTKGWKAETHTREIAPRKRGPQRTRASARE